MERGEKTTYTFFARTLAALVCQAFFLAAGTGAALEAAEQKTYTFAIVPQFTPSVIERDWIPLTARLSADTGLKLELKFSKSIPDFEQDFLSGGPDFVYLSPYHAVLARKAQGYIPLIRDAEPLVGVLVVRKDSPVRKVKQLNGAVVAFPSARAFASSMYLRALLSEKERIAFVPKYVTTHGNVYRHVILGMSAAGGGVNKTLHKESPDLREQLRIIYQTPPVPAHPLCVHPRVPASVRESVAGAILKLAGGEASQTLLKQVELSRPVRTDYEKDYASLEGLNLGKYAPQSGE
jgi:phosphonate transport system substrate-binding protein